MPDLYRREKDFCFVFVRYLSHLEALIYECVIYNSSDNSEAQLEFFFFFLYIYLYNGHKTTPIIMKNAYEIIFCHKASSQIQLRDFAIFVNTARCF